jgi:hypothetical protein
MPRYYHARLAMGIVRRRDARRPPDEAYSGVAFPLEAESGFRNVVRVTGAVVGGVLVAVTVKRQTQ